MTRLVTAIPLVLLTTLLTLRGCAGRSPSTTPIASPPVATAVPTAIPSPSPVPAPTDPPDLFVSVVRPVLKTHCSPCHEPGGKLYDRLPFDNPRVVSSRSPGILRRLKGEDREAFERWLATLKPEEAKPKGESG